MSEPVFRRGTFCATAECPEVAVLADGTRLVRSSRQPEVSVEFTAGEWEALGAGIKNGDWRST